MNNTGLKYNMSSEGMVTMSDTRRRVAEAVGWTEIEESRYWAEGYGWAYFVNTLIGTRPDGETSCEVPDYPNDANACIAALDAIVAAHIDNIYWELRNSWRDDKPEYWCEITDYHAAKYAERGAMPTLAICNALLAWAKARVT